MGMVRETRGAMARQMAGYVIPAAQPKTRSHAVTIGWIGPGRGTYRFPYVIALPMDPGDHDGATAGVTPPASFPATGRTT